MVRGRWITPDTIPTDTICRVLVIPDEIEIRAAVNGAISELIYPSNWEQVGAITPAQMAAAMDDMFWAYVQSECGGFVEVDIFTDQRAQGTAGGTYTANTDAGLNFTTGEAANAGNVSVAGAGWNVLAGVYHYDIWHVIKGDASYIALCWLRDETNNIILREGLHIINTLNVTGVLRVTGIVTLPATTQLLFYVRSNDTLATNGLGTPANVAGHPEVYGQAVFSRIADAP